MRRPAACPLLLLIVVLLLILPGVSRSASIQGGQKAAARSEGGDPAKGKVLFNHFCAACHGLSAKGNGINAANLDPGPANLTTQEVAKLKDPEIFEIIEKGGGATGLSVLMPPWGKTLPKDQIQHIVAYIRTLQPRPSEAEQPAAAANPAEPKAVRFTGLEKGSEADCPICHRKESVRRQLAPNLGHEGSKLNREWLFTFLKSPHRIRPIGFIPLSKTMMPNFQFSDEQANALVEYLMSLRDPGVSVRELGDLKLTPQEAEKGKSLFSDRFACDACHRIGGEGGIIGPNLKEAPKRLRPEWIIHWLKDPQAVRPDSPMPNFGMTDAEARSLIAYILTTGEGPVPVSNPAPLDPELVKKGEALVKEKNCTYCHVLDSYNSNERRRMATYDVLIQTTER